MDATSAVEGAVEARPKEPNLQAEKARSLALVIVVCMMVSVLR
jgi:hypothetical protein